VLAIYQRLSAVWTTHSATALTHVLVTAVVVARRCGPHSQQQRQRQRRRQQQRGGNRARATRSAWTEPEPEPEPELASQSGAGAGAGALSALTTLPASSTTPDSITPPTRPRPQRAATHQRQSRLEAAALFSELDADQSGTLAMAEVGRLVGALGVQLDDTGLTAAFVQMDGNNSGGPPDVGDHDMVFVVLPWCLSCCHGVCRARHGVCRVALHTLRPRMTGWTSGFGDLAVAWPRA
jgi:hypothetical protein